MINGKFGAEKIFSYIKKEDGGQLYYGSSDIWTEGIAKRPETG